VARVNDSRWVRCRLEVRALSFGCFPQEAIVVEVRLTTSPLSHHLTLFLLSLPPYQRAKTMDVQRSWHRVPPSISNVYSSVQILFFLNLSPTRHNLSMIISRRSTNVRSKSRVGAPSPTRTRPKFSKSRSGIGRKYWRRRFCHVRTNSSRMVTESTKEPGMRHCLSNELSSFQSL